MRPQGGKTIDITIRITELKSCLPLALVSGQEPWILALAKGDRQFHANLF